MISSSSVYRQFNASVSTKQSRYRYLGLFFACMIMLGDQYCFDNPMALQSQIQEQFGITNIQFNLLYTVYSLPNIVLPFFGGILIDKIGTRIAILIFSTILICGQIICFLGAYYTIFWVMILGRVVFGMGSESLNTAQNSIMAQWFGAQEMSLALGLCISIPKVGSALNSLISPIVIQLGGTVATAMLIGVGFLIFSNICGFALIYMDKESDRREHQNKMILENFLEANIDKLATPQHNAEKNPEDQDDQKSISSSSSEDDNSPELRPTKPPKEKQFLKKLKEEAHEEPKEEIKLADIAKMSGTFWILIIICMLTEALFVPFLDNGNDFFQVRFGFTSQQAGLFLMVPYIISAITTPFLGTLVDKLGRRGLLIITTSFIFLITHILLLILNCSSLCIQSGVPLLFLGQLIKSISFLGICFAFYASVVIPSIPLVVQHKLIGTAFGLTAVFQNTALAIFPLVTGMIFNQFSDVGPYKEPDLNRGYLYQSYFFVGMSLFNLFISVALQIVDKAGARRLQSNQDAIVARKRTISIKKSQVEEVNMGET